MQFMSSTMKLLSSWKTLFITSFTT